jgi:hypothetical protein
MSPINRKNIWIGLAEICSLNKRGQQNLDGFTKGFVNVIALAINRYNFRNLIKSQLQKMGLTLKRLEEAELFNLRLKKLAESINENNPIGFGDFYVFEK